MIVPISAGAAQPNAAHRAIAFFSTPEAMAQISPRLKSFRLVTQNVDGLSKRALPPSAVDDAQPLEMHGSVFRIQCTNCPYVTFDDHNPICPALGGTEDTVKDKAVEPAVLEKDLPHCPECQSLLRPGVVWFGEPVQYMGSTFNMLRNHCDLLLVVGTSSVVSKKKSIFVEMCNSFKVFALFEVYPASSYAKVAREVGAQVAVFNIERTLGDDEADFVFLGPCEETLPEALLVQELIKPLL